MCVCGAQRQQKTFLLARQPPFALLNRKQELSTFIRECFLMRKLLIGCGVVLVIFVAVFGYFSYRAFKGVASMVGQMQNLGAQLQATNAQYPFTAPQDGLIGQERFEDWLAVRREVVEVSSALMKEMEGVRNIGSAFSRVSDVLVRPGEALLAALANHQMSADEYLYVTGQVFGTLEDPDIVNRPEAQSLVSAFDRMRQESVQVSTNQSAPSLAQQVSTTQAQNVLQLMLGHEEQVVDVLTVSLGDVVLQQLLTMGAATTPQPMPTQVPPAVEPAPATGPATAPI